MTNQDETTNKRNGVRAGFLDLHAPTQYFLNEIVETLDSTSSGAMHVNFIETNFNEEITIEISIVNRKGVTTNVAN